MPHTDDRVETRGGVVPKRERIVPLWEPEAMADRHSRPTNVINVFKIIKTSTPSQPLQGFLESVAGEV